MNFAYFSYTMLFFTSLSFMFFVSYNFFLVLVYLEICALSTSALLVISAKAFDDHYFEFFSVVLITVIGAESAIAISLLVIMNKYGISLAGPEFSQLKG
jgi:NADH:ubiquinone oxidoreductase subunit K